MSKRSRAPAADEKDPTLTALIGSGFASPPMSDAFYSCAAQLAASTGARSEVVRNGRSVHNIVLSAALVRTLMNAVYAEPALVAALRGSLAEPALLGAQVIVAPPRCGAQELHRDTDAGARVLIQLAVSVSGRALRTRVHPRSQLEEHVTICRSAARAAALHAREAHALQPGGRALLYDGFLFHGGGDNDRDEPDPRLFIVFVDGAAPKETLSDIADANYFSAGQRLTRLTLPPQ